MSVASKNLFEILGNDPDEVPQAPVVPVEKAAARHGKRVESAPKDANVPQPSRGGRGGRRDNTTGSERAFQDRDTGRSANRGRPTDENSRSDRAGGRERGGRGGRGGRGRGGRGGADFDRHSRTGVTDSEKQLTKGWGDESGVGELKDEQAGEAQAEAERKQGFGTDGDAPRTADGEAPTENGAAGDDAEAEADKQKSFADWQAEQEDKRKALQSSLAIRKANEGAGKKLPEGKTLEHDEETNFIVGTGGKAKRERERKDKSNQLLLEHDYATRDTGSAPRGGRGGRGRGGRGDGTRGRGDGARGQRGDRGDRGGRSRGGPVRGTRGGISPNIADTGAFPSLGS